MVRVLISSSAWQTMWAEAERSYPGETAIYPLGALLPDRTASPLEGLVWGEGETLVLTHALLPDRQAADYGRAHARFLPAEAARASAELQEQAEALVRLHPRLALLTKLHSHPHPAGAFLSAGDVMLNVVRPEGRSWWVARGLEQGLLGVLYPSALDRQLAAPEHAIADAAPPADEAAAGSPGDEPAPGDDRREAGPPHAGCPAGQRIPSAGAGGSQAVCGGALSWRLACFVVDFEGNVERQPDAQIVADDDPLVQRALAPPYWATEQGRRWCNELKRSLRERGWEVSRNLLGRGWRRYLLRAPQGERPLVLCLPPELPSAPGRLLEVLDARTNDFRLLRLLGPAPSLEALEPLAALADDSRVEISAATGSGPHPDTTSAGTEAADD